MKLISVVGARPNFMKVAPLHRAFQRPGVTSKLVHTGQHYDARMSDVFWEQLDLPRPDYHLGVSGGSIPQQTANILTRFDNVLLAEQPDWVVVVGDVTSSLACALAAVQRGVRVAHVEAGLRSGDRRMPEEINRIQIDQLAERLFVTEQAGLDNLRREGIPDDRVRFVGNVMIDSLVRYRPKARACQTAKALGLLPGQYVLMTLHRPVNVDSAAGLAAVLQLVRAVAEQETVVLPLHPRTRANLLRFGLFTSLEAIPTLRLLDPQGYLECLDLMENALAVVTDSGGIQEETTFLQVPCLTCRETTERPCTVTLGTNTLLADMNPVTLQRHLANIRVGKAKRGQCPPLWDGRAADRIADALLH